MGLTYMFGNFGYYLEGFKNFAETGDVLNKEERLLVDFWNYLGANTKFKNISLNGFDSITFESKNRIFKLEVNDDFTYSLSYYYNYLIVDNGKCKDYSTPDDIYETTVKGDFYKLRNWLKKRNYLK